MIEQCGQVANAGLQLSASDRAALWRALAAASEAYLANVRSMPAAPTVTPQEVVQTLDVFDFDVPLPPVAALEAAVEALRQLQPHVRHPRHFGLFDAAPTTMGVIGETLSAMFNPCLASWAGSPFGVGTERRLVTAFGRRFGYREEGCDGTITSGGSEANFSALLLALTARFPGHHAHGLRGIDGNPVVYLTGEAHPSAIKAACMAGLGAAAVRLVPVDASLRMDVAALEERIRADHDAGLTPLMVTVTAGTTGAGTIDPIEKTADVAARYGLWLHVDAAWGGAAALLTELRPAFAGIERADSITFDAHKWMAVPIGVGLLLTRHPGLLTQTFHIGPSFLSNRDCDSVDPLMRSLRWSRGFAGLKILLSLAVAGWIGYEQTWRHQIQLGDVLRDLLRGQGWRVVNDTPLPVVCIVDEQEPENDDQHFLDLVAHEVNRSGEAKIFRVNLGTRPALRACITNYATTEHDITVLGGLLAQARQRIRAGELDQTVLDAEWGGQI
jgi:glutamate/tyrosine decarboxylase-like PLP-dependent enzyme